MRIKSTMQSLVSDFMLETKGRAANLLAESRKNEYKKWLPSVVKFNKEEFKQAKLGLKWTYEQMLKEGSEFSQASNDNWSKW